MKFWPSIWRAFFYFAIPAASVWHKELSGLIQDHSMPELCWQEYFVIGLASFIAGFTALRGYFDSGHSRLLDKLDTTTKPNES